MFPETSKSELEVPSRLRSEEAFKSYLVANWNAIFFVLSGAKLPKIFRRFWANVAK